MIGKKKRQRQDYKLSSVKGKEKQRDPESSDPELSFDESSSE